MISLIAAVSENSVIGFNGIIPWKIKGDMKRFKDLTLYHPVIMGKNTYESLPSRFRPLPYRKNIILSSSLKNSEGIYIARTIEESLYLTEGRDSYIIGGEIVYRSFLPLANRIELTRVHKNYEGDSFFPEIDSKEWTLEKESERFYEGDIEYSFLTYAKRQ